MDIYIYIYIYIHTYIFVSDGLQSSEEMGPLNSLKPWQVATADGACLAEKMPQISIEVFSGYCKLNEEVIDLIGSLLSGFRGALVPFQLGAINPYLVTW